MQLSFLDLVNLCDNYRQPGTISESETFIPFLLTPDPKSPKIGLLRPIVIDQLRLENESCKSSGSPPLFFFSNTESDRNYISLESWMDDHQKKSFHLSQLCEKWRDNGTFEQVCGPKKWRNERYPVYKRPFGLHDHPSTSSQVSEQDLNYAFELERSCCAIFGIVTYGVHMSIYRTISNGDAQDILIWVPTRSRTKPTFPLMLDNTVAGGIPSGMTVFDSLVKECEEEASLPADLVTTHTKCTGAISYFFQTSAGWLQPEVEYVYDLAVPANLDPYLFVPKPSDGEVEMFELLSRSEVIKRMQNGLFKPNCALVIIDLLIRLGYLTPDNEPDYMEILTRMHGRFQYEAW